MDRQSYVPFIRQMNSQNKNVQQAPFGYFHFYYGDLFQTGDVFIVLLNGGVFPPILVISNQFR